MKNRSQILNKILQKQKEFKNKQENEEILEVKIEDILKNQLRTSFNQNDEKKFSDLEKVEEISELNCLELKIKKPKFPLIGRIDSHQKIIYDIGDGNKPNGYEYYRRFPKNLKLKNKKEVVKRETGNNEFKYKCFAYDEKMKQAKSLKRINLLNEKKPRKNNLKTTNQPKT